MKVVGIKNAVGNIETILVVGEIDLKDYSVELYKLKGYPALWKIKIRNTMDENITTMELYSTLLLKAIDVCKKIQAGADVRNLCESTRGR